MSDRSPVDPLVAALENGHPEVRLPTSWRRLIATAVILSALSFLAAVVMFAIVYSEGHTRERQFCAGQISALVDKERQLKQTRDFLATQAGQKHTLFNDYIRGNALPRLNDEVAKQRESLPAVCLKYRR